MSFLIDELGGPRYFAGMSSRPSPTLVQAGVIAFAISVCGCKDPNPTFMFDSGSDGPRDTGADGADATEASGGAGAGGGGAGGDGGGAAAGAGGQAGGGAGAAGTGGATGAGGAS
jgi:hypothetical protein